MNQKETKKLGIIILDGWGIGEHDEADGIYNANTPFFDSLMQDYPHAELLTFGENVGLPPGQMGNSEVGHLNIGAGRVVYQDLVKISNAIETGELASNPVLMEALNLAKEKQVNVHFMGLLSNGGVHSEQSHLNALIDIAEANGNEKVFIHAFTDGRDCDPKSGKGFVADLQEHIKNTHAEIASVIGRYFAMDRDKRWERVKKAYDLLVHGKGNPALEPVEAIDYSYKNGITDEFIEPMVIEDMEGNPVATIQPGDVVIVFNFRTDRCREITVVLTQEDMPEFDMKTIPLHYYTMPRYDSKFKNVGVLFEKDNLTETMGEVVSKNGLTQLRIAETEKYPHVTFFFNGGREEPFEGEERIMISSPKVATYDMQPEMSAPEVADAVCDFINNNHPDLVILNFANADMVGHTGIYPAIIKAVETVDDKLKQVIETGLKDGYAFIIIADHGNSDNAINPDGTPNTAHSLNPVPIIIVDDKVKQVSNGVLADIAPTAFKIMGIDIPELMDGNSLI
jgi:2,3-bisphosphoglycerate-independent phosphoglycerate mutase